jgi:hypothetical protein
LVRFPGINLHAHSAASAPAAVTGARYAWLHLYRISALSYLALVAAMLGISLLLNENTLVYSLDDPYIHLAMARTWLRSHSLGISPGQFAPASSSPLWTLLLVGLSACVGLRERLPLVLNVVLSIAVLRAFWWGRAQLRGRDHDDERQWPVIALALPVLLNLPGLTLCAMEHVLHAALVLVFVVVLFVGLERGRIGSFVYALACVLPLVRLESQFVIAAAMLLLVKHRRLGAALGLGVSGALPIAALGIYTRAHGAFFLPNPIVAKAVPPLLDAWLGKWGYTLLGLSVHPLLVVVLLFSLRYRRKHTGLAADGFAFCFVIALLQVLFSTVGGIGLIDRYESYVLDLGLFFVFARPLAPSRAGWSDKLERGLVVLGIGEKLCLLATATLATNDIYLQQYQTARFVQQAFPNAHVAVNDIGLVSLRSSGPVTDLAGLGTTEILRELRKVADTRQLSRAAVEPTLQRNGADMIAIYTAWFKPELYRSWKHVGSWSLPRSPIVLGDARVDFFAPDAARAETLERRMRVFQPELPKAVQVKYAP